MPPSSALEWTHVCKFFFKILLDFPKEQRMTLPIFDLITNKYSGENVVLDQSIFNQIVRRDIIHKVNQYNVMYNRVTSKWVMSKGEVSGSGKKPFQQKKTGRARQGNKRSPNLYHGGRAHGARPRDYYFPLNKKVRLMGLKCMLTSKFLENNIIVVADNFTNNFTAEAFNFLRENRTAFVTSSNKFEHYDKTTKNLCYIHHMIPKDLNVNRLICSKYLIFTLSGLEELVELLAERQFNYYRNKKFPLNPDTKTKALPTDKFTFDFDPNSTLKLYTPVLWGSKGKIIEYTKDPEKWKQTIYKRRQEEEETAKKQLEEKKSRKAIDSIYNDEAILDKRRRFLQKERRLKLLKDERRNKIKMKKQADAAKAAILEKKTKNK
jgi:large subunit ribosomal protein L4